MKLEKSEIEIFIMLLNTAKFNYQEHLNLETLRRKLVDEYKILQTPEAEKTTKRDK